MLFARKIEDLISIILTIGIVISCLLVLVGGILFLSQHTGENISLVSLQTTHYTPTSFKQVLQNVFSFSANAIIELGLFALVITQIVRVGLLALFYFYQKDSKFTLISFFIFSLLIYSIVLQK